MDENKNIQNLSENGQTGADSRMQNDAKAKYMQTDFSAEIGEADTWMSGKPCPPDQPRGD